MHRARRVSLLAVLALAGTVALTGCRSQPGVAVYVGGTEYRQEQVDKLASEVKGTPIAPRGAEATTVAGWLVLRDVGRKLVAEKKLPPPRVDAAGIAEQTGLKPGSAAAKLFAEHLAYQNALVGTVQPVRPTTAEYEDLLQRFIAAGLAPPSTDLATFRERLQGDDLDLVSTRLALRKVYEDGVKHAKVTVNPRYSPAEASILSDQEGHAIIVVPLNSRPGTGPAVHDRA